MDTLVPVTAGQSPTVTYRSLEAGRDFQRHAIFAFAIAVVLHAMVIAISFLFSENDGGEVKRPARSGVPELIPIDTDRGWRPKPQGNPNGKVGIPIPVPIVDAEVEHDSTSLGRSGWNGVIGGDGGGDDDEPIDGDGQTPFEMPEDDKPLEIHFVEREPVLVKRATPKYPVLLLKAQVEGRVTLKLWVDKEGKVREVHVLKSDNEMFNEAAIEAAWQFLFTPAYMNAGPVSVWVSVPFTFTLK
jgi:protein TonB